MKTFDEDFFCIENFIVKKECFHYREIHTMYVTM